MPPTDISSPQDAAAASRQAIGSRCRVAGDGHVSSSSATLRHSGSPGIMRLIDTSPSLGHDVTVTVPGGETFRVEPGRPLVQITPSGGTAIETSAWCVDWRRAIDEGVNYPVDLQTSADAPELGGPAAGGDHRLAHCALRRPDRRRRFSRVRRPPRSRWPCGS